MPESNILQTICDKRLQTVEQLMQLVPMAEMRDQAEAKKGQQRGFTHVLQASAGPAMITEIKKASPSMGDIREGSYDPAALAKELQDAGATALSVLSEPDWFKGAIEHVTQARNACTLPVLRKDFIVHEWQVYETAASGADAMLLIVAALDRQKLHAFYSLGTALGMDVLVEVHNLEELERAMGIDSLKMVGINNRDLKTLDINIHHSTSLRPLIPDQILCISESGIKDPQTVFSLYHSGFKGFLIGHALMQETNPSDALKMLLGR